MKLIDISTLKYPNTFTMVDEGAFAFLSQWKWRPKPDGRTIYARRMTERPNRKDILMHRLIMNYPINLKTDHKDGNGLNNQIENLRLCNNVENGSNRKKSKNGVTSKYIGVCYLKERNRYCANIKYKGKTFIKYCKTEREAAIARNEMALRLQGEFARLNIIERDL